MGRFSATWVRALAIDDGETMVMVVSVDVVGMDDTLSQVGLFGFFTFLWGGWCVGLLQTCG